jgi:hypothetical protein
VNPGGEPERDETGLPPVDIEIPDDARELDRDVQAYYREQRAQRRQQRGHRMRGSLARDGIVLPLLACCLILALITGTLLTVFTATSDQLPNLPGTGKTTRPSASSHAAPSSAAAGGATSAAASPPAPGSGQAGRPAIPEVVPSLLPPAAIAVDGRAPIPVRHLSRAALVLIPAGCNCTATVSWLIGVVATAHARSYLVYTASTRTAVGRLYDSLGSSQRAHAVLALDPTGQLTDSITDSPPAGLSAILVGRKHVAYATGLSKRDNTATLIRALAH